MILLNKLLEKDLLLVIPQGIRLPIQLAIQREVQTKHLIRIVRRHQTVHWQVLATVPMAVELFIILSMFQSVLFRVSVLKLKIFCERSLNLNFLGNGQSIANSQFPGQGNTVNDDPGSCSLESVPEVPNLEQTTADDVSATEKKVVPEKKTSYDMQTQATEQRNMSTQTDAAPAPSYQRSNSLNTPRSFSQNALRSGNLDAGKLIHA